MDIANSVPNEANITGPAICNEVRNILHEFVDRDRLYMYSPYYKRKLFTSEDYQDFLHKSTLTIDDYIKIHNLHYKWKRRHIREHFTYKQEREFQNSELSLDNYVDKHHLCVNPHTAYTEPEDDYYSDNDYSDFSDEDSIGWGDDI